MAAALTCVCHESAASAAAALTRLLLTDSVWRETRENLKHKERERRKKNTKLKSFFFYYFFT